METPVPLLGSLRERAARELAPEMAGARAGVLRCAVGSPCVAAADAGVPLAELHDLGVHSVQVQPIVRCLQRSSR
jgi:hypothetical protein